METAISIAFMCLTIGSWFSSVVLLFALTTMTYENLRRAGKEKRTAAQTVFDPTGMWSELMDCVTFNPKYASDPSYARTARYTRIALLIAIGMEIVFPIMRMLDL